MKYQFKHSLGHLSNSGYLLQLVLQNLKYSDEYDDSGKKKPRPIEIDVKLLLTHFGKTNVKQQVS